VEVDPRLLGSAAEPAEARAMDPVTLPFDTFWSWLVTHPNCIVRAGTPEAVLYDDEDLHWHFAREEPATLLVQLIRGKRLLGEILVDPEPVSYVQGAAGEEEGEYVFELVSETGSERLAAYFFVLAHGYETLQPFTPGRVH
jgi:hypothetical protein